MLRVERGDDDFLDSKGKRKVILLFLPVSAVVNYTYTITSVQLWDVIIEVCS